MARTNSGFQFSESDMYTALTTFDLAWWRRLCTKTTHSKNHNSMEARRSGFGFATLSLIRRRRG